MESLGHLKVPAAKVARYETDYSICIICQQNTEDVLVEKPTAHEKVLKFIQERASYGEGHYPELSRRLGDITSKDLESKSATWHRKCYQDTVHTGMCNRAKKKYEKQLATRGARRHSSESLSSESAESGTFTRSQSVPYEKHLCFFCEQGASFRNPLHMVATENAGHALKEAVKKSNNDKFCVKLCTTINPDDAHAIDLKYHKRCWATHVTHVLRRESDVACAKPSACDEFAAEVEFLSLVEGELLDGHIINMAVLQDAYTSILSANNVKSPACSRKKLKKLIQREIPHVEFHKPKRVFEPERVSIKLTRDDAIQFVEDNNADVDMKALFNAASILRRAISKTKPWAFNGSLSDVNEEHLPKELYSFYRWVLQGPNTTLSNDAKSSAVNKNATSLAQTTVSMFLSKHQITRKKTQTLRVVREMPQQLAVGLAIRQAIRGKKIINLLHGFGLSVEYNRLLRMESQIASSVLQRMLENDSTYLPPDIIHGRYVFFAVDNVDFAEDTPDGKNTLHATAMAIYQRCQHGDEACKLALTSPSQSRSINNLPGTVSALLECSKPAMQPQSPTFPSFSEKANEQPPLTQCIPDVVWLLGQTMATLKTKPCETQLDECPINEQVANSHGHIPTWSGYHSMVNTNLPVTRVGAPPLIAAPAHEWNTLLTVLKQAQKINAQVVGPERKTVISLDMGLYKPAKQLQMARKDMDHLVLRPGELHIVMAQLRTIGAYIENSGLDFCWTEADLYSPATVKQILEGRHVRRGIEAHLVTLQALFMLYQEAFFQNYPELVGRLMSATDDLRLACSGGSYESIQQSHTNMVQVIESLRLMEKMAQFDCQGGKQPLFLVMRQYMQMVMEMLQFIRSVRTGDWNLHMLATKSFAKYFFAHSKLNYARMIPVYLADMEALKQSDADIYNEFLQGNWVVNKNSQVPFCAVGADHALEHINRSMKVSGGLVGITSNASARTKFFLIAPELARLVSEAKEIAGLSSGAQITHHALCEAAIKRHENSVADFDRTLKNFINPFTQECGELFNLVTKAVMPEKVTIDLCRQSALGQQLFEDFVCKRIKTDTINVWAPMKKCQLQTWKSTGKRMKLNLGQKVVELKEDRSLFARMLIVSKSRPDINLEEAVGRHELSVVPRSLFAADGEMLHCPKKSKLMAIIERLPENTGVNYEAFEHGDISDHGRLDSMRVCGNKSDTASRVVLVDGMAEVQAMGKPDWIKNCSQLAEHFSSRILKKHNCMDEIRVIFDRYDVHPSLKESTRNRRQGNQTSVAYHITDTTNIAAVPLKRLLSHANTKMEMTGYLAEKMLEHAWVAGQSVVVAWGTQCRATHSDKSYIDSDHEEADTKLILHAVDATVCGATSISICSPDTDVFILAVCRYPELCKDTTFVTGTGRDHRVIQLGPIYEALGQEKAAALPGLHALSGCDNTGGFAGKGKQSFWEAFQNANEAIISALANLGTTTKLDDNTFALIEQFICKVYLPQSKITEVSKLRWWLFKKKQAESEKLPPTPDALRQTILRAHHQAIVWNSATTACPVIPSPKDYGWKHDGNGWSPIMTTELPAPKSVLHLVKCGCKMQCQTNRCSCRKAGLYCTDICSCSDKEESCDNVENENTECDDNDDDSDNGE